jgi:hypothetical protein
MMNCVKWIVVFAIGSWTHPCLSQLSIAPAAPRELETVCVQLPEGALGFDINGRPDNFDGRATKLTMENNKITVSLLMVGGNGFGSPQALDWPLGKLLPGSYQVEVVKRSAIHFNEGVVGTASFEVLPRSESGAFFNVSDLYFDVDDPGWGMSVTHLESGGLFLIWFAYDANTQPTWYFVSNGTWAFRDKGAMSFTGAVFKSTGADLFGPRDSSLFHVSTVGNAEIAFFSGDSSIAAFALTVNGKTISKTIRRQRL